MFFITVFAIIIACGVLLFVLINIGYSLIYRYLMKGGMKEEYVVPKRRVRFVSSCVLAFCGVFSIGFAQLLIENACIGLTAEEAFRAYAVQSEIDVSSYRKIKDKDLTFFVSEEEGESWLAYQKTGFWYARAYNLANYYHYYLVKEDGTFGGLVATVAEVKTSDSYFYFMDFFNGSILQRTQKDEVVFNGSVVELQEENYLQTSEKLVSFSVIGGGKISTLS